MSSSSLALTVRQLRQHFQALDRLIHHIASITHEFGFCALNRSSKRGTANSSVTCIRQSWPGFNLPSML
jgi:hypothetical protein